MCETAPWSKQPRPTSEGVIEDNNEAEEKDDDAMEMGPMVTTNSDTQQGQARLRIRLVMKGRASTSPPSPKRARDLEEDVFEGEFEDLSHIKRRYGQRCFSDSPPPSLRV